MKACKLLFPRRVVGMGGIWQWPDGRDLPDNFEMICEYPARHDGICPRHDEQPRGCRSSDPRLPRHDVFHGLRLGRQGQGRQSPRRTQKDRRAKTSISTTPTCTITSETATRSTGPVELGMAGVAAVQHGQRILAIRPDDRLGRKEPEDDPGGRNGLRPGAGRKILSERPGARR